MTDDSPIRVRLDKWLWAARFFKTRSRAGAAIKAGKVDVGGKAAKASHKISVGERVDVRKGPYTFEVDVIGLSDRRRGADHARTLYAEGEDSMRRRAETHERLAADRAGAAPWAGRGRPTKKDRRALDEFRRLYANPEDWVGDDD